MGVLFLLLKVLGLLLLAVLVLLLLLLILPTAVTVRYTAAETTVFITLLGLVRFRFPTELIKKITHAEDKKSQEAKSGGEAEKGKKKSAKQPSTHKRKKLTLALAFELLGDVSAAGKKLLGALHITVEDGYFPLTGRDKTGFPDAAATADLYGRTSAALGALLACLRNLLPLKVEHLRLVPDFTGEQGGTQYCTCKIQAKPVIIGATGIVLLYRLWKSGVL